MNIRTVAFDNSEQIDWTRDSGPHAITIVLEDGRLITVNGDGIVVNGPDMETLFEGPLPNPEGVAGCDICGRTDDHRHTDAEYGFDLPAGAGAAVEADRG